MRRASSLFLVVSIFLALPTSAHAVLLISEVMYNPDGADSGREWIELYNHGEEPVTIMAGSGSGSWRIVDSSNHTFTNPSGGVGHGSLTVPASGFLIISSDPSVFDQEYGNPSYPVIKASITLNNTGNTITLLDGAGKVHNAFTYDSGMGAEDNGNSIQFAHGGWIQAKPTPGTANATEEYVPPEDTSDTDSSSSGGSSMPSSSYVPPPAPTVFADAGENKEVVVGADTLFRARAYNRDQKHLKTSTFSWNFGDGGVAEGPRVFHAFAYPGTYKVELNVKDDDFSVSSQILVTAKEVEVGFDTLQDGGVAISNSNSQDLDVSFWKVADGGKTFVLPEHSVVLKDGVMRISPDTLGFVAANAALKYPNGKPVLVSEVKEIAVAAQPQAAQKATQPTPKPYVPPAPAVVKASALKTEPQPKDIEESPQEEAAEPEPYTRALAASAQSSGAALPLQVSMGALGGLIGLGIGAILHLRRLKEGPETLVLAEEFEIE